ncbi:MAG: hypothetical protein SCALA702_12170 [Melioribacteraceae bacterium]|nr:MAG: hypothetical protein SCALA702_12170 [Melioribacteraceae bacterium]
MKFNYLLSFLLLVAVSLQAQIDLLGSINPNQFSSYSDIWGYVDENNREYAIMGGYSGTHVIDVTDPSAPSIVGFIPGPESIWRDIKVHDQYAYVTTEGSGFGEGLQIIDLTNVPNSISLANTVDQYFTSAHNIFIDDGYAFVVGTDGIGGIHILDLADPVNPVQTAYYTQSGYVHDVYVWSDTIVACAASTYDLVDITDKANPFKISESAALPGIYAHSGWMTEDKRYFVACEEFNQRDITVWDLEDRSTWELVVPEWQMDTGSIVHNLFIKGNYAHISYYTDGYVVLDITDPTQPLLAGSYDTDTQTNSGFNGAWGCYPYLPSGNVIISDINEGLFILSFNPTNIAPVISLSSSPEFVNNTDDVLISAQVDDDKAIDDAKLYYRTIISDDTSSWNSVSDLNGPTENLYGFYIPGQEHLTDVQYYIAAIDSDDEVTTLPAGGSGVDPIGQTPPETFLHYSVVIAGIPVIESYAPAVMDTTVSKGDIINFAVIASDTTNLGISVKWYWNGIKLVEGNTYEYSTFFSPAQTIDTVEAVISNGFNEVSVTWYVTVDIALSVPDGNVYTYNLEQNYPNPFNPSTNISFSLENPGNVELTVYSITGEIVARLLSGHMGKGTHSVRFDARGYGSGVYIARINSGDFSQTIKMILQK